MLFKHLFTTLINEADEEEETPEETEEEPEESEEEETPEEEPEESEEEETPEEEPEEEPEGDEFSGDGDEEPSMDGEGDEEAEGDGEEEVVKGNPHAKKMYFKRFEKVEDLIKRFQETIKDQEVYYKNDDETEKRNKDIVTYITGELNNSLDQISYLLEKGVINSLDIKATQNIYAKMKTKLDQCIKLYSKVIKVKL